MEAMLDGVCLCGISTRTSMHVVGLMAHTYGRQLAQQFTDTVTAVLRQMNKADEVLLSMCVCMCMCVCVCVCVCVCACVVA
jgi:hypothetical protein